MNPSGWPRRRENRPPTSVPCRFSCSGADGGCSSLPTSDSAHRSIMPIRAQKYPYGSDDRNVSSSSWHCSAVNVGPVGGGYIRQAYGLHLGESVCSLAAGDVMTPDENHYAHARGHRGHPPIRYVAGPGTVAGLCDSTTRHPRESSRAASESAAECASQRQCRGRPQVSALIEDDDRQWCHGPTSPVSTPPSCARWCPTDFYWGLQRRCVASRVSTRYREKPAAGEV